VGRCQRHKNCLKYAFDLAIDFTIRKAKDFVASLGQRFVTHRVALPMTVEAVLMSIDFDDHA